MKMADLAFYGYPAGLIAIWEKEESPDLLPLQEEAIIKHNFLANFSKNLLLIVDRDALRTCLSIPRLVLR
jgi:hypothetical protein